MLNPNRNGFLIKTAEDKLVRCHDRKYFFLGQSWIWTLQRCFFHSDEMMWKVGFHSNCGSSFLEHVTRSHLWSVVCSHDTHLAASFLIFKSWNKTDNTSNPRFLLISRDDLYFMKQYFVNISNSPFLIFRKSQ